MTDTVHIVERQGAEYRFESTRWDMDNYLAERVSFNNLYKYLCCYKGDSIRKLHLLTGETILEEIYFSFLIPQFLWTEQQ